MKRLTVIAILLFVWTIIRADGLRTSDSVSCKYLGSLYYGENVGYQLNFESESLNLLNKTGEGKLIAVTIVVPSKGRKSNTLPEGEFLLGDCDTLKTDALDFYESNVQYFGYKSDAFAKPDEICAFLECKVTVTKVKRKIYNIHIEYELVNGEKGDYTYEGKVKVEKHNERAAYKFMTQAPRIINFELTETSLKLSDETAYSSRKAMMEFACGDDIFGMAVIYLPLDSINGHYEMKYGKEPGTCEPSAGGYDAHGFFNLFNTGIDDGSSGSVYYPESGYIDIKKEKMFFEFVTRDGSTIRGVFKKEVSAVYPNMGE